MLEIPEEIKNIYRRDNLSADTAVKIRLKFYDDEIDTLYPYETLWPAEDLFPAEHEGEPWLLIENDRIETESLSLTESLSSSEDMEFGSCEGATFEIVVADVIEDVTGREFTATVEVGNYEMAFGIYTVESFVRQADRRKRKITAYDRMRRFDTDVAGWYNELVFPMTIKQFRDSLCDYVGVPQNDQTLPLDSIQISKTIEPEQISGRDILQAICQINGCFGHIDKTGQLVYVMLQQTGLYPAEDLWPEETLYPSEFGGDGMPVEHINYYKDLQYEDYLVEGISGLTIRQEEGDIGANVGTGDNPYVIEGNFLVYGKSAVELLNITQSLLPYISGRIYRPVQLTCYAMPWLEVGDAVQALTRDDIVETFVMKRTLKGSQAMMDTIEATGAKHREESFGINKQIVQLEGKTAVIIKNVDEVSVRVTNLKEETEAQFKVTADQISAEVKRASDAEGELSGRITVNEKNINLKVSKGQVSSEISVESGQVTLRSNRLIVDSTNFKLDSAGNATFSGNITGGTINIGNVFTVNSSGDTNITGSHFTWSATNSSMTSDGTITCNNLKASNGTFSGNITGSAISGGSIEGTEIEVGPFYASDSEVTMGDYSVSIDGSHQLASLDGSILMQTSRGGPMGSYPALRLSEGSSETILTGHHLDINHITTYSILTEDSDTADGWTIGAYLDWIYDELQELSDRSVKTNIEDIDPEDAIEFLCRHTPITFQYTTDGKWSAGFIAQDVEALEDEMEIYYPLVYTDRVTNKEAIKYINYIPLLTAAVQYLNEQIAVLKGGVSG